MDVPLGYLGWGQAPWGSVLGISRRLKLPGDVEGAELPKILLRGAEVEAGSGVQSRGTQGAAVGNAV